MDAFVKKLFPNCDAPGLPFVELGPGTINHTYMQGIFATKPPYVSQNKTFYSIKPMTMLGRTTADVNAYASSVDGLGKPYVTPQGQLNLDTIIQTVRTSMGGTQAQVDRIRSWSWNDNHTTLLVNALRYVPITKTMEISGDIDNKLPEFSDGRIRIDPNFGMRSTSDSNWDKNDWPAGTDSAKALGCSHACQAKEYHYIDMANMTWPVLRGPDDVGNQVVLAEQDQMGAYKMKCITLPHIDSNFFHQ